MLFQSGFNLIGIFAFLPFMNKFSEFLQRLFVTTEKDSFILDIAPRVPKHLMGGYIVRY